MKKSWLPFQLRVLARYLAALRRPSFPDRPALERWQQQRVVAHLRRVVPQSPWLRERFMSMPLERWQELPTVGKAEMMEHFDTLNTVGITQDEALEVALKAERTRDFSPLLGSMTVGLSSGTSGGRGLFIASEAERAAWAAQALARILPGPLWHGHRIALFLRASSPLYGSVGTRFVDFRWFDLFLPISEQMEDLEAYQPTILVGPPSALRLIANDAPKIAPLKIVCAAETLDALDRSYLERHFHLPVDEVYQATEGFLATTDAQHVLRLHEDLLVVEPEWLDGGRTHFVPIITDFHRTSQPMIRHRLDDVLAVHPHHGEEPYRGLSAIAGRCDDLLQLGRSVIFPDLVARALIAADASLEDFRVTQTGPASFELAVQAASGPAVAVATLREILQRLSGGVSDLEIQPVPFPESEAPSMKRRRIRQRWSPPPLASAIT